MKARTILAARIESEGRAAVLSIDAKKKENTGNFRNNGREYAQKGRGALVYDHDFRGKNRGKPHTAHMIYW
jgi:hypothetical protein